jgi:hypothetical protein
MGDVSKRRFEQREDELIREGFASGVTDKQMVDVLAEHGFSRGYYSIYTRRKTLGLVNRRLSAAPKRFGRPPPADAAFVRAMLAAVKSGEEKAILGVVKDRRPWALKRMQPEPVASGCSSPESWV